LKGSLARDQYRRYREEVPALIPFI